MKKNKVLIVLFSAGFAFFSQAQVLPLSVSDDGVQNHYYTTTETAGLVVPEVGIRSSDEIYASEEFRRGVQAYYKGSYNNALIQFEKSLSYMPDDNLILYWLGKTYYKTGLEGNALSYWTSASQSGYGGLLLQNKIEIVRERRVTGEPSDKTTRLSESGSFPGFFNGNMIFSGPTSVQTNNDGTVWLVSYNTNELLLLNQNGKVIDRITGPLNGFDRPVDIIRLKDGNLLVSESAGDRLSLLNSRGKFVKYIGSRGRSTGQLVGPQYLAQDEFERIYVTDYGNRRIDVFDPEGNGLFSFGTDLKGPTGIAVDGERVFVADDNDGCIYEYDRAGNYIRMLVEKETLKKPEAMRIWNSSLIVCDSNRLLDVDMNTGAIFEYTRTGNAPSRLMTASADVNGNVMAADFTANELYVFSKVQELVGGMFIQIETVDASAFPKVVIEVKAENRHRQPVVGLQEENFYISENKRPVSSMQFIGSASNNTDADITMIISCSQSSLAHKTEIETAVREIAASMNGRGVLRVITASEIPVAEYEGSPTGVERFSFEALKNKPSKNVVLDSAIRLAVNELINAAKKRSIILISDGNFGHESFAKYNLAELTAYMNNNSVLFSHVQVGMDYITSELDYILNNTSGNNYYVYRPEGLSRIVSDIIAIPQGVYQLSYISSLQNNFGQEFLPVEAEVYLLNRSGRDESGYFAPLQ